MRLLRPAIGFLSVMTLALAPVVSPVGPFVDDASANDACSPSETTFTGNGTIGTDDVVYKVLEFTTTGTCNWTVPNGVSSAEYLVVGGGGGGGGTFTGFGEGGGGGGAGGLLQGTVSALTAGASIEVTVGAGGAGGQGNTAGQTDGVRPENGTNSRISFPTPVEATGGGAGGHSDSTYTDWEDVVHLSVWRGQGGGSGGGATGPYARCFNTDGTRENPCDENDEVGFIAGGSGISGQGSNGQAAYGAIGGGGGGAGGSAVGGNGGPGASSTITGSAVSYAVGGPNASSGSVPSESGSGGRGGAALGNDGTSGQDGIIILRYTLTPDAPVSPTATASAGTVSLSWTAPSHTGGITPVYYIEYKSGADAWTCWNSCGVSSATSRTITGLTDGTTYSFRISATNATVAPSRSTAEVSATPRKSQVLTWSPNPTFINTDITTSVSLSPLAAVLGEVSVTYAVSSTTGTANCTISDSSTPNVSSISGSGTCVVSATSAQGEYEQATASVTLTVFDGAGSANSCDQNVSGLTISTTELDGDCVVTISAHSGGSGTWVVPQGISSFRYLLVGGGGGGGANFAGNNRGPGGGGAGGFIEGELVDGLASSYTVKVGVGGAGGTRDTQANARGRSGSNSEAFGEVAYGGGGGGASSTAKDPSPAEVDGLSGASGGGGGHFNGGGGSTLYSAQGNRGGDSSAFAWVSGGGGGGGGGASQDGQQSPGSPGGAGGDGSASDITGSTVYYAGGGAGAYGWTDSSAVEGTPGGLGGGGAGGTTYRDAFDGVDGRGGGGGGARAVSVGGLVSTTEGGDGGSGIVVVRYTRSAQVGFSASIPVASVENGSTAIISSSGGSGTGAVSYAVTSGDCSISGTTVTATGGTGLCVVTATKAADASYAEATSSVTLTLSKAAQSSLSISVDDSALDYGDTATLSPSGGSGTGAVTFSVDSGDCSISGTTVTATGGTTDCVISAVKAGDDDYVQASSANTVTISISKAAQTITFASISNVTYGAASFTVSPTSNSGLVVSVSSSTPSVCTTSGLTVTLVGAGTCTLTANQAGNSFYSSATGVTRSFTVAAKAITVSVVVSDKVYDATTSATVSSGTLSGVVSGDVVSFVAGNAAAAFGSATVGSGKAVTVTLDGDELTGSDAGNYSLSASGSPTATVTAKPVTVNVVPSGKTYDGTQVATVSSATVVGKEADDTVGVNTSKVSVIFDAPGAGTQFASATLSSGVLTGADAGNYTASVGTVSSAVISKANQASLSFTSSSSTLFGQTLTLVATGGSGSGSISYLASGDCTISGAVISPTGAGSCSVSATRAADSNYNVSSQATQTVTIAKANQSINFTSTVPTSAVSGTTYTPAATATSGLTVSYAITTGSGTVCSLASGVVTFLTSGTCVITATQGGDSDYNAASSVTQTIVAGKINQTITFPSISGKDFDDAAFLAGATVSSGRTVTFATSTGSVCAVNASTGLISIKTIGDCTVTASSAGDASYAAASDVSRTFTIKPVVAGKPSVTSVSFGNSSVTVAFGAPGANGGDSIDAYQVVATSSGGSVTKPDCSTTSPCTISGLTNGESYTLTVAAINAAGVGPASDASPAVIPATIPDAVSALSTTPGDTQLVVDWSKATSFGGGSFTRYEVYLRVRGNSWGTPVSITDVNTETYTFTGLTNGTAYDVKIVTISTANGSELSSNTATALGVPATAPVAPTGLTATALSNTTAVASWTAPVDDGGSAITAYSVNLSCTFVNATDAFCALTGLTAGSRVTVTVGATNLMGTGSTVSVSITMPGGSSGSPGGGSSGGAASPATVAATNPPVLSPRRVIVPAQPTPIPRLFAAPVRILPERGFDPDAGSKARIAGQPATVTKRPLGDGGLSVEAGAFQLGITMTTPEVSAPSVPSSGSRSDVSIPTGQSTKVTGGGLLPGSNLQVWLPGMTGDNPRELARIPVKADGTFDSELSFTSRQSETPLPIGRQVLQVTGFDEDGNQTVVDMTINIGQGAPAPELNRAINSLPDLAPGQSLATSAGTPETVTIEARPEDREVAVLSGEWSFMVSLPEESGVVEEAGSGATVTLIQARTATVSGDGFQPDTRVDIWLFSDPTLLGSVIVSADGSFTGEVYLDARYAVPGEHTLQLQGVADDGFIKAANLGVVVQEPVEFTTENATGLLWWVISAFLLALAVFLVLLALRRRRGV